MTECETAAAVAELQEIARGRGDPLAEAADVLLGFHERELDEARVAVDDGTCRLQDGLSRHGPSPPA
jgi:hypothetical protein